MSKGSNPCIHHQLNWEKKQKVDFQILPRHKGLKKSCVTKFIEIQTVETALELRETWKQPLQTLKEGMNSPANTNEGEDGRTWRRLKRTAIVVFQNLFS